MDLKNSLSMRVLADALKLIGVTEDSMKTWPMPTQLTSGKADAMIQELVDEVGYAEAVNKVAAHILSTWQN